MAENSTLLQISDFTSLTQISLLDFVNIVKPLMFFIIGISVYCLFIYKFYKFLAKRDILELGLHRYSSGFTGFLEKLMVGFFYVLENLIVIPLCIFFWFLILVALILVLTHNPDPEQVLLIAFSLVAAVRVTAYFSENLSQDVAKVVPFAMLGVFLIDISFISLSETFDLLKDLLSHWQTGVYYLFIVVVLEFILRMCYHMVKFFSSPPKDDEYAPPS